jgi:hypothetical protein
VIGLHIDPTIVVNGRIDMDRLRPVARLGYLDPHSSDDISIFATSATNLID